jgi:ActR/RegA family two-component response regulator
MEKHRVLLVDDDAELRTVYMLGLEHHGFEVVPAATVNEALNLISTQTFDALLTDLHMPDPAGGFTVVSAMRHKQPNAITLVNSGYPAIEEAMTTILLQADEVLVKPLKMTKIAEIIKEKLSNPSAHLSKAKECVASILDRDADTTIRHWLSRVEQTKELTALSLNFQERTGHLPRLMRDLVRRLRLLPNSKLLVSEAAQEHGVLRRIQGYTVPMLVEESRILQVSIFNTLQNNLGTVDFSTVLLDVMTIADEVDSQLKQTMLGYMDPLPAKAASLVS